MSKDKGKKKFKKSLKQAYEDYLRDNHFIFQDRGDVAMVFHTERPYLGQPQTVHGKRGRSRVCGLTMRDVGDAIARAWAQSACPNKQTGYVVDLEALVQNTVVNLEKLMGIFPNVPQLDERKGDGQ
ncbi:MAG: hypothetical protein ABFE07_28570 [Armatimonadia bacterium]